MKNQYRIDIFCRGLTGGTFQKTYYLWSVSIQQLKRQKAFCALLSKLGSSVTGYEIGLVTFDLPTHDFYCGV